MSSSQSDFSKDRSQVDKHVKNMAKGERRRKLAAERKKFRRNQQPKGPRRKDWVPDNLDALRFDEWRDGDWDIGEYDDYERIMPIDEAERRRSLEKSIHVVDRAPETGEEKSDLSEGHTTLGSVEQNLVSGLVVEFGSGLCRVEFESGASETQAPLVCSIRGSLSELDTGFTNPVAVGDRVLVRMDASGDGVVESVLPRSSILSRPDVFLSHLRQVLVANADQILIVAAWRQPAIWFELIDRYLIAAARSELPAIICVNKIDLADSPAQVEEALAPYVALGIPILLTSAELGVGIETLGAQMEGRSTALTGLSGVGKSTLLTALRPDLALRTGEVSDRRQEGRHTTTQASLIRLDATTTVVDTPGIREFGLAGLARRDLAGYFPEIARASKACRFRNCAHLDDPDCAVTAAVARGEISQQRYHSYCQIHSGLR